MADRTVLITGGTGGLGRAVVAAFAANGWRVVVLDKRAAGLDGADVLEVDLTDAGQVADALRTFGPVDVVSSTGRA
jgi:NAD(P)-dependent dehydrogenase (short-subunit alcohol dehydrogenase family)